MEIAQWTQQGSSLRARDQNKGLLRPKYIMKQLQQLTKGRKERWRNKSGKNSLIVNCTWEQTSSYRGTRREGQRQTGGGSNQNPNGTFVMAPGIRFKDQMLEIPRHPWYLSMDKNLTDEQIENMAAIRRKIPRMVEARRLAEASREKEATQKLDPMIDTESRTMNNHGE